MTTEPELLAAIAAALDDDAPRLVYADWLTERGDPRGELIHLQTMLARMPEEDERRKPTEKRVKAILTEHQDRWLGRLVELRRHGIQYGFERGVIGAVTGTPSVLAKHAAKILEAAPLLTRVHLMVQTDNDLAPLAGSPLAARIRALQIDGNGHGLSDFDEVVLPELRELELGTITLSPKGLAVLASPQLSAVRFERCRFNKGVVEAFARVCGPMRRLELPSAHFEVRIAEIIGTTPSYRSLETLALARNELGRRGLDLVMPALANVEYLDLRGNDLRVPDLQQLLDPAALPKVRALLLGANPLGDGGAAAVLASALAPQLTRLHLGDAGVTAVGARALAGAAKLANLRALTLTGKRFDPETEALLVASPHLANARIYAGDRFLARTPKPPPRRRA